MILCCGEALVDMIPVEGLQEASHSTKTVKISGYKSVPGGSPYNTAIAIGRMGVPVKFLSKFSNDFFSEILLKNLKDNKVGDDLIIHSSQNTTIAFVKTEKGKEPNYIFYSEGTAACSLTVDDLPKKLPSDTHCIMFGSIAMTVDPASTAIETLIQRENAMQGVGKDPLVISFDPNIRPFMIKDKKVYIKQVEKWIAASTIAKISAADFEYMYPGLDHEKALHKVLAMGPRIAICTLGQKGAEAMLRRNDGTIVKVSAPVVNLPVADTIGAGDTFHGAFLSWLELHGKMSRANLAVVTEGDLYEALFFANKAASIVCSRRGAEPPNLKEVNSLKAPTGSTAKAKTETKKTTAKKSTGKK